MPSKTMGLLLLSFQIRGGGSRSASLPNVGHQSMCENMSVLTEPAGMWPGHHAIAGTRNAPSNGVPFSPRNGV